MAKIVSFSLLAAVLILGSFSLRAAELISDLSAKEQSIVLHQDLLSFWEPKLVHLKKGQELVVEVANPDDQWHNAAIDKDYAFCYDEDVANAVNCELRNGSDWHYWTGTAPNCLRMENTQNSNGDPMTYHFKADAISGESYIYFQYYQQDEDSLMIQTFYFPRYIRVIVDEN